MLGTRLGSAGTPPARPGHVLGRPLAGEEGGGVMCPGPLRSPRPIPRAGSQGARLAEGLAPLPTPRGLTRVMLGRGVEGGGGRSAPGRGSQLSPRSPRPSQGEAWGVVNSPESRAPPPPPPGHRRVFLTHLIRKHASCQICPVWDSDVPSFDPLQVHKL